VTLSFSNESGVIRKVDAKMPARSRATFRVGQYVPDDFNVSTAVESDVPVVAERSTYWDKRQADQPYQMMEGHATVGAYMGGPLWTVPEGSTGVGFETYISIYNAGEAATDVAVTFMTQAGARPPVTVNVPAGARRTICVSDYAPNEFQVSALVTAGGGEIVVERSMYWDRRGTSPFGAYSLRPYEMMGGSSSNGMGAWGFLD
jgi:hypothetical protein